MLEDSTLAAATDIIRELARNGDSTNVEKLTLPGPDTPAKRAYETELAALHARINHLRKIAAASTRAFPMTPNEPDAPPFDSLANRNGAATTMSRRSTLIYPSQIAEFMNPRDGADEGVERQARPEELGHVRGFVQKQAEEIQANRKIIDDVEQQLHRQKDHTEQSISKVENEDIKQLHRELRKHQQANLAFQKALKEIGSIVTNVANGDLNHKVLIHKVEMDPEITKFKRTSAFGQPS